MERLQTSGGAHLVVDGDRQATVVFDRDVDIAVEYRARRLFDEVVERRPGVLVLDFCATRFADAAAVRLALRAQAVVAEYGGRLVIKAPPPVQRLLELTGTIGVLPVTPCPSS